MLQDEFSAPRRRKAFPSLWKGRDNPVRRRSGSQLLPGFPLKSGCLSAPAAAVSFISCRNCDSSPINIDVISYIFFPHTVTASASFFRRCPLHSRHGVIRINVSYSCLVASDPVSRYLRSTFRIKPSNAHRICHLRRAVLHSRPEPLFLRFHAAEYPEFSADIPQKVYPDRSDILLPVPARSHLQKIPGC